MPNCPAGKDEIYKKFRFVNNLWNAYKVKYIATRAIQRLSRLSRCRYVKVSPPAGAAVCPVCHSHGAHQPLVSDNAVYVHQPYVHQPFVWGNTMCNTHI